MNEKAMPMITVEGGDGKMTAEATVWEPWSPVVGQRVRVLARPECYYCREEGADEVGVVGTVFEIKPMDPSIDEPGASAHVYWVEAEEGEFASGLSHFAAVELEEA